MESFGSGIMSAALTMERLIASAVVPVVRTSDAVLAAMAIDWLREGGFKTFEITLTIPWAIDLIASYAKQPDLLIGAGTVLTAEEARDCIAAGASYLVSPCIAQEVAAVSHAAGVACMIGALTPTEVQTAAALGPDAVKIFPASSVGGPGYIKALKAVFPDIALVPTGGVDVSSIAAYLAAGAAFVGVGGELVDEQALRQGDRKKIISTAQRLLSQAAQGRAQAERNRSDE